VNVEPDPAADSESESETDAEQPESDSKDGTAHTSNAESQETVCKQSPNGDVEEEAGIGGLIVSGLDSLAAPGVAERLCVPPLGRDTRIYSVAQVPRALGADLAQHAWSLVSPTTKRFNGHIGHDLEERDFLQFKEHMLNSSSANTADADGESIAESMQFVPAAVRHRGCLVAPTLQQSEQIARIHSHDAMLFEPRSDVGTVLEIHSIGASSDADLDDEDDENDDDRPPAWVRTLWKDAVTRAIEGEDGDGERQ